MQFGRDRAGGDESVAAYTFPLRGLAVAVVSVAAVWWWRIWSASGTRIEGAMNFDALFYWLPLVRETARQWRSGSVPLWNPYQALGTPLLATLQVGALYPFNALYLLLEPSWAWLCTAILHQAIAGAGLFALCRQLKLSPAASFVGACALGFSWLALLKVYDQPQFTTLAWVPVGLACAELLLVSPSLLSTLLLCVSCALPVLAGHPGTIAYSSILVGTYILARSAMIGRHDRRRAAGILLAAAVAAALAIGLSAVQWLPTRELVQRSVRAAGALTAGQQMLGTADPYRIFSGAPGTVMLALALYGAFTWRRRGPAWFFAGTSCALLLFAIVPGTEIFQGARTLPGGSWFRAWNRVLVLWPVCMAVLAAAGAETFGAPDTSSGRRLWVMTACVAAAVGVRFLMTKPDQMLRSVALALAFDILPIGAVGLLIPLRPRLPLGLRRRLHPCVILALCCPIAALLPTTIVEHLSIHQFDTLYAPYRQLFDELRATAPARTLSLLSVANGHVWAKLGTYFEVAVLNDLEPLSQTDFQAFRVALSGQNPWWFAAVFMGEVAPPERQFASRWLDLSGVRFVVADEDSAKQLGRWFSVPLPTKANPSLAAITVLENPYAMPRSFFVADDRARALHADCVGDVQSPSFDPAHDLVLDDSAMPVVSGLLDRETSTVEILGYRPSDVRLRVDSGGSGFVVLTDAFFPGWSADVDGVDTEVLRADCFFRAVRVSAGRHTVRFRYRPNSFRLGAQISFGALAVVTIAAIGGICRSRWRGPSTRG